MRFETTIGLILGMLCAVGFGQQPEALQIGDVIFQTDFEGDNALEGWSGSAKLEVGFDSDQAMGIERPTGPANGAAVAQYVLPVEKVRGCLLHLSGMIKAENVSDKPKSWNGIKYMAPTVAPGGRSYPQAQVGTGTFDWKRFVFPVRVPEDATDWRLYMGLEAVTGKVWFDDLKVVVRKLPFVPKPRVTDGPPFKGHDLDRLRGAMISPNIQEESLQLFAETWNANLARWQLVGYPSKEGVLDLGHYDAWLADQLEKVDAAIPLCEKYGMYLVLDLHSQPAGGKESGANLFSSKACQDKFIANWRMMAARYKDCKVIWAYDLVNEPIEHTVAEGLMDWQELAEATGKAIREIDPQTPIIVEPATGGGPWGFVHFNPIDVPRVLYSVHMYLPHAFTHQGVHSEWTKQLSYPGEIQGQVWDKARIKLALKPAIDFANNFGVHMYVGEFSAIRWAPDKSAFRYIRDCIEVFEELGWDWTYHAFREWTGWSVEHTTDKDNPAAAPEPTERQKLLMQWLAKNEKPGWAQP